MKNPRQYDRFPYQRPNTPLLDLAPVPAELRKLNEEQLPQLANELREHLLYCVSQSGGHFGAGLGVVELTVALHYLLDTPRDKLVWDVGHQTYPHKILTGRRDEMHSMRQAEGLSGFPKRKESEYDTFGVGHSSTSISAALGMALAHQGEQPPRQTVAVIGDGAMYFYIQDVIIHPEHQNKGLGSKIMNTLIAHLASCCAPGATIGLLAAHGKENFYLKFGFEPRDGQSLGLGMCKFI